MSRMMAWAALLLALLMPLAGLAQGGGQGRAAPAVCAAPEELLEPSAALPGTARAIAAGELRLLVLGSASVLGPGGSGPAAAWPARLEALLRARYPRLNLALTVHGGRGLTAADQVGLLRAETPRLRPQLVIWQTGTVEAARRIDPDQLVEPLGRGLDGLRAAGGEAVLMDLQFSRFLRANADVEPYADALRLVAAAHDAPLFRRYELMRLWADSDRIDLERAERADRPALTDRLNDCLAHALLRLLEQAVALH